MPEAIDTIPAICRRIQTLAERDPRRAVVLARRAYARMPGDQPLFRAWASYTLGHALRCWERFDEARPYLLAAQAAFELAGQTVMCLRCRFALLLCDLMQFARADLEPEFIALARAFELAGAQNDAVRPRIYQAILLDILGRSREVQHIFEHMEGDLLPVDRARMLYIRGAVAISLGDYPGASALLEEAVQAFTALHNPLERARCLFQQAWLALRQEQMDAALARYKRAQIVFSHLDLPLRQALCDKGIGLLLTRLGRYDEALPALLRASSVFSKLGRTSDIAACQLNLGNVYLYVGLWEAALACYTSAEALYSSVGVVGERMLARRNRAMSYRAMKRLSEAEALLIDVEAEARQLGNLVEVAEVWMNLADVLVDDGRFQDAIRRYMQAHDLFLQLGNQPSAAECLMELGWLALRDGAIDQAEALFRDAAPALSVHPHHRWRDQHGLARCSELRGEGMTALEHYRGALATIAGLRRRLAIEGVSSGLYAQASELHADALRLAVALNQAEAAIAIAEGQRALVLGRLLAERASQLPAEYQAEYDHLRHTIETLSTLAAHEHAETGMSALDAALAAFGELLLRARYSKAGEPPIPAEPPFDLELARAALCHAYGDDWTALIYIWNSDTLLIGVVTPSGAVLEQTSFDDHLRELIERASQPAYRYHTYRDLPYHTGQTKQPWLGLRTLAKRLLPTFVQARMHPQHRLLIVPAGPLHGLPWSALRLEAGWLAEHAVVQLVPSLRTWLMLIDRSIDRQGAALLVGCSAFGARARPLPAVTEELNAIATRWLGAVDIQLDDKATRAMLLARSATGSLGSCGLIHLATHARLLRERGLAAHVKLWDADLLLPEIVGLHLGSGMVVLSACDGAVADVLPGEEILSLSWAFLASGACAVLASLWPVEDAVSALFMAAFYNAFLLYSDAAAALTHAQRSLIAMQGGQSASEPQSWGCFVLIGSGVAKEIETLHP